MAGQIDQNVDFILPDQFSEFGIVEPGCITKPGCFSNSIRDPVIDASRAVGKGTDLSWIMRQQYVFQQEPDGVLAEVC